MIRTIELYVKMLKLSEPMGTSPQRKSRTNTNDNHHGVCMQLRSSRAPPPTKRKPKINTNTRSRHILRDLEKATLSRLVFPCAHDPRTVSVTNLQFKSIPRKCVCNEKNCLSMFWPWVRRAKKTSLMPAARIGEHNSDFHCWSSAFATPWGRVLVKVLGVDSGTRASETCMFAIFIAPVDRESQHKFLWVIKTIK